MFRAIREIKPTWIVAENVPGLLTIEDGLVFERVCADLENEGYEVQPVIIPACATNAPHRRDRIWIVAYSKNFRRSGREDIDNRPQRENLQGEQGGNNEIRCESFRQGGNVTKNPLSIRCDSSKPKEEYEDGRFGKFSSGDDVRVRNESDASDTENTKCKFSRNTRTRRNGFANNSSDAANNNNNKGLERSEKAGNIRSSGKKSYQQFGGRIKEREHWYEAATRLCIVDDGLSGRLDGITVSKWRKESLMAAGNAIVPQVAYEIFKAIQSSIPTGGAD